MILDTAKLLADRVISVLKQPHTSDWNVRKMREVCRNPVRVVQAAAASIVTRFCPRQTVWVGRIVGLKHHAE